MQSHEAGHRPNRSPTHSAGVDWGDGDDPDFSSQPPDTWYWRLLIRTPDFVEAKDVQAAIAALQARGKIPGTEQVELTTVSEGRCAQILHIGPYNEEGRTMHKLAEYVAAHGLQFTGRHHEIYLSDPRRVEPDKLRTILRMPVSAT